MKGVAGHDTGSISIIRVEEPAPVVEYPLEETDSSDSSDHDKSLEKEGYANGG